MISEHDDYIEGHHVVALMNNCLKDTLQLDFLSTDLKEAWKQQYISFRELKHAQWGVSRANEVKAENVTSVALRWLTDNDYMDMYNDERTGKWRNTIKQKLFDEDELPIGFKKRIID